MGNPARAKGTRAEVAAMEYLRANGWPDTDRRALQGRFDKGDLKWLPWVAIEVKNTRTPRVGEWLRETETERTNLGADIGAVLHKPHGTSLTNPGAWHVHMTFDTFIRLVELAERGRDGLLAAPDQ